MEFIGCQFLMVSWNFGQKANLNDGITSALILFASPFILFFSYLIYKDKISKIQGGGLTIILLGVTVISIFKASTESIGGIMEEKIEENTLAKLGCILAGKHIYYDYNTLSIVLMADVCFAFEIILIKVLAKYKVDGDIVGIFFCFFVGIIGIISLSVYSISGGMANEAFEKKDFIIISLGGCVETLGMMATIYASAIGNAGIAFAISNTCCIYVTFFDYFALSQAITIVQILGIAFCLLGATVIALEE